MNTNNLKPFNLEQAKAGAPVVARDGHPVRIVCFDQAGTKFPIIALRSEGGAEIHGSYNEQGSYWDNGSGDYRDLFMAPVERTVWVNLWTDHERECIESEEEVYPTEEAARKAVGGTTRHYTYHGAFPITFTE